MEHLAESTASSYKELTPLERAEREVRWYNADRGSLYEEDGYNCDRCNNRGWIAKVIYIGERPECVLADCECMEVRRSLRRMRASGMDRLAERCTFANFETTEPWQKALVDQVIAFTENPGGQRWLYIGGQSGAGKTHLGVAAAVKIMKETHMRARYYVWPDEIRKTWGDSDAYEWFIDSCQKAPILYLDDLFKPTDSARTPSANEIRAAFAILNHRYNNTEGVTIISSEYPLTDVIGFDEALGGRIYQRTQEGTALTIKKDQRRNYRLKGEVVI